MSPLYDCPHCQTQNFYTRARIRLISKVPLECWKCGNEVKKARAKKRSPKKGDRRN